MLLLRNDVTVILKSSLVRHSNKGVCVCVRACMRACACDCVFILYITVSNFSFMSVLVFLD